MLHGFLCTGGGRSHQLRLQLLGVDSGKSCRSADHGRGWHGRGRVTGGRRAAVGALGMPGMELDPTHGAEEKPDC